MTQKFDKKLVQDTLNSSLKLLRDKEDGEIIPTFREKVISYITKKQKPILKTALLVGACAAGLMIGLDAGSGWTDWLVQKSQPVADLVTSAGDFVIDGGASIGNAATETEGFIKDAWLCPNKLTVVSDQMDNLGGLVTAGGGMIQDFATTIPGLVETCAEPVMKVTGGGVGLVAGYGGGRIVKGVGECAAAVADMFDPTAEESENRKKDNYRDNDGNDYRQQYAFVTRMEQNLKPIKQMMFNPEALQVKDADGNTIVDYVAEMGDIQMIRKLKKLGANFDAENKDGITPRMRLKKNVRNPAFLNDIIGERTCASLKRQQRDAEMREQMTQQSQQSLQERVQDALEQTKSVIGKVTPTLIAKGKTLVPQQKDIRVATR